MSVLSKFQNTVMGPQPNTILESVFKSNYLSLMAQMRLLMVEHVPAYLATGPDWCGITCQCDDITLKYAAPGCS